MPDAHRVGFAETAWCVDQDLSSEEAEPACRVVIQAMAGRIAVAMVDAYACRETDQLPAEAAAAQADLFAIHSNGMGVTLSLADADHHRILIDFAAWSINVELNDVQGRLLANFHDCGTDVVFAADDHELQLIRRDLASSSLPLAALKDANSRHRASSSESANRPRRWYRMRGRG